MSTQDFAAEVKDWLKKEGRNPQWLADQCGTKISVVYSWFSTRGFPEDQKRRIIDIMRPDDSTSMIRVPFTDKQLADTHRAANLVGAEFQDYCQRAIESQVRTDINRNTQVGNGTDG